MQQGPLNTLERALLRLPKFVCPNPAVQARFSKTGVDVRWRQCTRVNATIVNASLRERRPCTAQKKTQRLYFVRDQGLVVYASCMASDTILALIDVEIAKLMKARAVLAKASGISNKLGDTAINKVKGKAKTSKKRVLSPEARKRIADAQRKRWAAQKTKASAK